jgi:plasmid stabilization system protein ParE
VARVEFLPGVGEDLQRIVGHLERYEVEHIQARIGEIVSAFDVLRDNPLIGRLASNDMRELVIGSGSHGYLALYKYVTVVDAVFVLAIRAQREGGYARDE